MTIANVQITEVLLKRGNTVRAGSYVGPVGEVVIDTDLQTLRVQDGITPGGMSILATQSQISTLANTIGNIEGVSLNLGNIQSLLANLSSITSGSGNLSANNFSVTSIESSYAGAGNITVNAQNIFLQAQQNLFLQTPNVVFNDSTVQTTAYTGNWQANAAVLYTDIQTLNANEVTLATQIAQVNANVTAANAAIVTANTALKNYTDSSISTAINNLINSAPGTLDTLGQIAANLSADANSIGTIIGGIAAANINIATLQTQVYSNANVAAYLPTSTIITGINANITAANAVINTLATTSYVSSQITAATISATNEVNSANSAMLANITAANVNIATLQTQVYANANVAAYLTTANITTTGNVQASYLLGNGSKLTNITATYIGAAQVTGGYNSGTNTGYITLSPNGLIQSGSYSLTLSTPNTYPGSNNINIAPGTQGNVVVSGNLLLAGNTAYFGNLNTTGNITASNVVVTGNFYGNVIGAATVLQNNAAGTYSAFIDSQGALRLPTNIYGASSFQPNSSYNIITFNTGSPAVTWQFWPSGLTNLPGNVQINTGNIILYNGNITTANNIIAVGNITGSNFLFANGVNILSTVAASSTYSNANVYAFISNIYSNDAAFSSNISSLQSNINGFYTWANTNFSIGTYSNTNVAAYLTGNITTGNITTNGIYWANGVAWTTGTSGTTYSNANVVANLAAGSVTIGSGAAGWLLRTLVGGTSAALYNASVTPSASNYTLISDGAATTINGTTGIYSGINNSIITSITSASGFVVSGNIQGSNLNLTGANLYAGGSNVVATLSTHTTWLGNLQANVYANANTAAYMTTYLPTYTGNVGAGNVVGTTSNVTITAGSYVYSFLNNGVSILSNVVTNANITTTANVIAPNYLFANGVNILSTIAPSSTYSNTNVAAYISNVITSTGNITAANVTATGNIYGNVIATTVSANTLTLSGTALNGVAYTQQYVQAGLSTNQTITTANTRVAFATISAGSGITLDGNGGFNLTAGVTYLLEAAVGGSSSGFCYFQWTNGAGTVLSGSSTGATIKAGNALTDGPQPIASCIYTPSVNTTVYLTSVDPNGTTVAYAPGVTNYSSTWATVTQIAGTAYFLGNASFGNLYVNGNIYSNGSLVTPGVNSYLYGTLTSNQTIGSSGAWTPINSWTANNASGLSYTTSGSNQVIALQAGLTYELEARISVDYTSTASGWINYQWYNDTNSTWIGSMGVAYSVTWTENASDKPNAYLIYTPAVNTNVRLVYAADAISGLILDGHDGQSWMSIKQLGFSSLTSNVSIGGGATSTSTTTGAIVVTGGAGISGNLYAGGNIVTTGGVFWSNGTAYSSGGGTTYSNVNVAAYLSGNVTTASITTAITNGNLIIDPNGSGNVYFASSTPVVVANTLTVAGNVTANYFLGNGSQLTGIIANAYANVYGTSSNVTLIAGSYTWTFDNTGNLTIPTTSNIIYANGTVFTSGTGGSGTYSNANVVAMLSANSAVTIGNVNPYPSQANIVSLYVGNLTALTSGYGLTANSSALLNNLYYDTTGTLRYRSASSSGAAQITFDGGGGVNFRGIAGTTISNAAATVSLWGTISSTGISSVSGLATSSGALTTSASTGTLFNTTATTINLGGAATVVTIGTTNVNVQVGGSTMTGNISAGNIYVSGGTGLGGAYALDVGVVNPWYSNTIASFSANINNYTQVTLQNLSNGAAATSDYIITADNGTDSTNYVDLGIINSGYNNATPNNSLGNIVYKGDAYLYAQGNTSSTFGGNLAIGTTIPGKTVNIFAGGATNINQVITISNTGAAVTGNVTATYFLGNGSALTGITANNYGNIYGTSSNITLVAGSYSTVFDNTGNITLSANSTIKSGNLFVANAGGVYGQVPAYNTGTWTPSIVGGSSNPSLTYGSQNGNYTKIGNMVFATGYINIGSISSQGSGTLQIAGLPFQVLDEMVLFNFSDTGAITSYYTSSLTQIYGHGTGGNLINLRGAGPGTSTATINLGSLGTGYLLFSCYYRTNA